MKKVLSIVTISIFVLGMAANAQAQEICDDLAGVNFMTGTGAPQPLGAGVVDGACSNIFGISVPAGIELFANTDDCNAACFPCYTNDDCAADEYCNLSVAPDVCAATGSCEARAEICATIYDPICSCSNTIVSSACSATMSGNSVQYAGECPQEDVCNSNGGTWASAYDIVGNTQFSPSIALTPDGQVTFGMPNWWEDDVYACYNTYLEPAYLFYFAGCDRDGSGLVEIQEVLDMYYYVLDYPTGGVPAYSGPADGCHCPAGTEYNYQRGCQAI